MAAGVNAKISVGIEGELVGANDLATVGAKVALEKVMRLAPGTGLGKADLLFSDQRTLAASATENLDLAGVLTDPLGVVIAAAKIKAIFIFAAAANTNSVVVGAAASNPFTGPLGGTTPTLTVAPGGMILLTNPAGWAVTATTADLLKIANSAAGTPVTYDVLIFGSTV